jgi:hypothetical protein
MVIIHRIRQSAVLLSTSVMIGYERHSETERVAVCYDGLINQSVLKIQSSLYGDIENQLFDGDKQIHSCHQQEA